MLQTKTMDGGRRTDIWITKSLPELSSGETKRPNFACDNYIFSKNKEKQEQTMYPFHTP